MQGAARATMTALPTWTDAPGVRDEARSVWENLTTNERVAAPLSSLHDVMTPIMRPANAPDNIWPDREWSRPITVELVRQAGDEWKVCIDGQLCHESPKSELDLQTESERAADAKVHPDRYPACALPPPLRSDQPIAPDSSCRKLLFACRLEDDALQPASVKLVVDQINMSFERRDQSADAVSERRDAIATYDLKCYSISDSSADALIMPYPFAAPAQSSLGIIDYNPLQAWYDRKAVHDWTQSRTTKYVSEEMEMGEPKPPKNKPKVITLGSGQTSAPKAVDALLKTIVDAFNEVVRIEKATNFELARLADKKNWKPQRAAEIRIEMLRTVLDVKGETQALELFDALSWGPPIPLDIDVRAASEAAEVANAVQPTSAAADEGIAVRVAGGSARAPHDTATDAPVPSNAGATKEQARATDLGSKWYKFVYDNLLYDQRSKSHVQIQYHLEIAEFDGSIQKLYIRPRMHYAHVAHAVYALLEADEQSLRISIANVRNVLRQLHETPKTPLKDVVRPFVKSVASDIARRGWAKRKLAISAAKYYAREQYREGNVGRRRASRIYGQVGTFLKDAVGGNVQSLVNSALTSFYYIPAPTMEARILGTAVGFLPNLTYTAIMNIVDAKPSSKKRTHESKRLDNMESVLDQLYVMCGFETGPSWPEQELQQTTRMTTTTTSTSTSTARVKLDVPTHTRTMPQVVHAQKTLRLPSLKKPDIVDPPYEWPNPNLWRPGWTSYASYAMRFVFNYASYLMLMYFLSSLGYITAAASYQMLYSPEVLRSYALDGTAWGVGISRILSAATTIATYFNVATAGAATFARSLELFLPTIFGAISSSTSGVEAAVDAATGHGLWAAATTGIPAAYYLRKRIVNDENRRETMEKARKTYTDQAKRDIRGNPIESALANARVAMQNLKDVEDVFLRLRVDDRRFFLRQDYKQGRDMDSGVAMQVLDTDAWDASPKSGHLTLSPPVQTMDALFETLELRRVGAARAIVDTVGTALPGVAHYPAAMAAQTAYSEFVAAVAADRHPFKAKHLLDSVASATSDLATRAADVMLAAYGTKAGVTFVQGDDPLWSCVKGGPVARLALRNLAAFEEAMINADAERVNVLNLRRRAHASPEYRAWMTADAARADALKRLQREQDKIGSLSNLQSGSSNGGAVFEPLMQAQQDYVKSLAEGWSKRRDYYASGASMAEADAVGTMGNQTQEDWRYTRRRHVDAFVAEWKASAQSVLRNEKSATASAIAEISTRDLIAQVARSNVRMQALGLKQLGPIILVSSAPRLLRLLQSDPNDVDVGRIAGALDVAALDATNADEHVQLRRRSGVVSQKQALAAWAARRLDTAPKLEPRADNQTVDTLIQKLSRMSTVASTTARQEAQYAHYYCPTGTTLDGVPGRIPYSVGGAMIRLVWLADLADALGLVARSLVPTGPRNAIVISESVKRRSYSHHPLVIRVRPGRIEPRLQFIDKVEHVNVDALPHTLVGAATFLQRTGPEAGMLGRWTRNVAVCARQIAFVADRYKHCLGAAWMQSYDSGERAVHVADAFPDPREQNVVSEAGSKLALALAIEMYGSETGQTIPPFTAECLDDAQVTRARTSLTRARDACRSAVSTCKAVHMSEVCILLSKYT